MAIDRSEQNWPDTIEIELQDADNLLFQCYMRAKLPADLDARVRAFIYRKPVSTVPHS